MQVTVSFTIERDHPNYEYELEVMTERYNNSKIVTDLYDTVFRPIIKYSQNQNEIKAFEKVWEEVYKFMQDVRE
jgi:hypothetical protein